MELSISKSHNIPILYGILTAFDYNQALDRSLVNKKDKGGEAANAITSILWDPLYLKIDDI